MCGKCEHWGQLVLRLAIGPIFIAHGYEKIFIDGHTKITLFLSNLGIPLPGIAAWLLMVTEFFGGIFLLWGFLTRWASIPIAFAMLVAILTAHSPWQHSLIGPGGFEKPLALMAMALSLVVQGGGKFSADHWLRKNKPAPPPAA